MNLSLLSLSIRKAPLCTLLIAPALLILGSTAQASTAQARIFSSDGQARDQFGASLSTSGNTVVIGAWGAGDSEGLAYVSTRSASGWSTPTALVAPVEPGDDFGWSVAVDGDAIVVGSRLASEPDSVAEPLIETGAVTFFARNSSGWSAQQQVYSSGRDENAGFGFAVDLLGTTALVGEPGADDLSQNLEEIGAAYVYSRNSDRTWREAQRLVLPNAASGDVLGMRVKLSQVGSRTFAFASVLGRDDKGAASGAVAVFERSSANASFVYRQTLVASDGRQGDQFGYALDVQGDRLLVGAPGVDLGSVQDAGAAYVFEFGGGTWTQRAKITRGLGQSRELLGSKVALRGDELALGHNPDGRVSGASEQVSLFQRKSATEYALKGSFRAPLGTGRASFASALAYSGSTLLVGMNEGPGKNGLATGVVLEFDPQSVPAPLGGLLGLGGLGLGLIALRRRQR